MAMIGRNWYPPKKNDAWKYGDRGYAGSPGSPLAGSQNQYGQYYDPRTQEQWMNDYLADRKKAQERSDALYSGSSGYTPYGTSKSGSSSSSGGSSSISSGTPPTAPDIDEYQNPEYNDRKVKALAQMAAGPGLRALRNQMASAMGQTYENPNVGAMATRNALQGYGAGLGDIMSSAHGQAASEYGQEYASEVDAARVNYDAEQRQKQTEYEMAWNEYIRQQDWAREQARYEAEQKWREEERAYQREQLEKQREWEREQARLANQRATSGSRYTGTSGTPHRYVGVSA